MAKKLFTILLILSLSLSLAACGGGNAEKPSETAEQSGENSESAGEPKDDDSAKGAAAVGGIYKTPNEELNDYYNAVSNIIKSHEDGITELTSNPKNSLFSQDYVVPTVQMATIGMFDYLEAMGKDKGEYRKTSGGIIGFGEEYTIEQESFNPNEKTGDIMKVDGTLNTNTNTLFLEATATRGGTIVKRTVTEVVIVSNDVLVLQMLEMPYESDIHDNSGNAYFIVCNGDDIEVIYANLPYDTAFTYDTIVSKGLLDADDMAAGYTLVRKMSVIDGTATAEKY